MKELTKFRTSKKNRGMYLHAASIKIKGKALLFLGHSSSGKSTISRLLSKQYPLIADDKVWIELNKNGKWIVCEGEDFLLPIKPAASPNGRKKKYPLLAVLRIFKSNKSGIKSVIPLETCRYIMDAVFEIDIQRKQSDLKIIKKWFSLAAEISRKISGWELTFKKDMSIINLIYEKFDQKFE